MMKSLSMLVMFQRSVQFIKKYFFVFAIVLIVLTWIISYWMAIQEGIPKEGDDRKLVNYAYWLCDLQVTDDEALCNALYRPVQAFGSIYELRDNIKGQNDGKGQSYNIRRMDPSGTIGSIIESNNADYEAQTIFDFWKKTNWKEWK